MKRLLAGALLCLIPFGMAKAQEECVFSETAFGSDWIESHPNLKKYPYKWVRASKELIVRTASNERLSVIGGGCTHYSESISLTIQSSKMNQKDANWLRQKVIWLAKSTLRQQDAGELMRSIQGKRLDVRQGARKTFLLNSTVYPEFALVIERADDVIITIDFYQN